MENELRELATSGEGVSDMDKFRSALTKMYDYLEEKKVETLNMKALIRHAFIAVMVDAGMGIGLKNTKDMYISIRFTGDPNPKSGSSRPLNLFDCQLFINNIDGYIRGISLLRVSLEHKLPNECTQQRVCTATKIIPDEELSKFPRKFRAKL